MPTRIFTEQALTAGAEIDLDAAASTHLIKVLRLAVGAELELFNGDGHNYRARIIRAAKRARIRVDARAPGSPPSPARITLVQGISRGDRMDFSVQKAAELGVAAIQPVFTEKSKVKLDGDRLAKKAQHWLSVARSACEQSGRSEVPTLHPAVPLRTLLQQRVEQPSLVLAFGDYPGLTDALAPGTSGPVSVLIGPESGLSDDEVQAALAAGWSPCHLGPRVLRTETATVAALSLLQLTLGDLGEL